MKFYNASQKFQERSFKLDEFKLLTEDELTALSSKDRREYLRKKKAYENEKLVHETVESASMSEPIVVNSPKATAEPEPISISAPEKKSNAGRKKMDSDKKKKQMVLTLSPDTYNRLQSWAESKPRSAPNYVSDFIEEHLNILLY